MNTTKRVLELIAAIFSIVLGTILAIGSILLLVGLNDIQYVEGANLLQVITIFILLGSAAIIIVASLLCPSPMKNGVMRKRFGLQIALSVLMGVVAILELIGGSIVYFILFLAPLVLMIVSMCLKNENPAAKVQNVEQPTNKIDAE